MHDTINGAMFKEMLLFGTVSIAQAQQAINDLNVFPVPDGDTGTNMSLTIQTAAQELKKIEPATVDQAASVTASALLRGARGNSGVILSLLFRGISKELKGCKEADGAAFAAALQEGVAAAYNAVMKPAEGTILTVSRLAAERAVNAAEEHNSVEYVIEQAIAQGEITLAQTTDMNPVLKKGRRRRRGRQGLPADSRRYAQRPARRGAPRAHRRECTGEGRFCHAQRRGHHLHVRHRVHRPQEWTQH